MLADAGSPSHSVVSFGGNNAIIFILYLKRNKLLCSDRIYCGSRDWVNTCSQTPHGTCSLFSHGDYSCGKTAIISLNEKFGDVVVTVK